MSPWRSSFLLVLALLCVISCHSSPLLTIPLSGGAEDGEYTLTVTAGTPPQPFTVRVSTAFSALTSCKKQYRPNLSSTYSKVPCSIDCACVPGINECGYRERYSEGITVVGDVTNDIVQLNTLSNASAVFVRFNNQPPSLYGSSTDGILGLSKWVPQYPNLHLLSQVENITHSSDFSLCLGEFGGALVLGGYDPQYLGSEITWIPVRENANFTLELTDMKIETSTLFDFFNLTGRNCTSCVYATIDAGSQFLRLPASAYGAAKSLFQQRICMNHHSAGAIVVAVCGSETLFEGNCYILDDSTIDQFPTLYLSFGEFVLTLPPTNYLVDFNGKSCLGIEMGSGDNVIIGNRIIQEYYTIFEPNNNLVGFAKSANCSGAQHKVILISGNHQTGVVGTRIHQPLVVKVIRLNDSMPVQGINVVFNVVDTGVTGDVMWISEAIWKSSPPRVEPAEVTTDENGTAWTYVWCSGTPGANTVTADTPLSLKHVIFTARGDPSSLWRIFSYLFLAALVAAVVLLNLWYRKIMKRRQLYQSKSNSIINLVSPEVLRRNNSVDYLSPPMSPVFSPKPDFSKRDIYDENDNAIADGDEFDDSRYSRNKSWGWRLKDRVNRLFYNRP